MDAHERIIKRYKSQSELFERRYIEARDEVLRLRMTLRHIANDLVSDNQTVRYIQTVASRSLEESFEHTTDF